MIRVRLCVQGTPQAWAGEREVAGPEASGPHLRPTKSDGEPSAWEEQEEQGPGARVHVCVHLHVQTMYVCVCMGTHLCACP